MAGSASQPYLEGFLELAREVPSPKRGGERRDHLLFFAVLLDDHSRAATLARYDWAKRIFRWRHTPRPPERFHVTLQVAFTSDEAIPERIIEAAREAASLVRFDPFPLAFDRIEVFLPSKALVLRGDGGHVALTALNRRLGHALRLRGLSPHGVSGTPHITLAYARPLTYPVEVQPMQMMVREFQLIDSLKGQGYTVLGRWKAQA
ncbi:2'-5' RNA ligase family protein [Roseococcus sp. YIM B11640]|uniref:2'-5' RNA ligase family protein n=1 Tax=Roseococcus sp. YIM B11640 TaxID=3133973 RepID=UPI003C7BB4F5